MTLMELAERCERAIGPDPQLDRAIAIAGFFAANYTASLDAAMTLVPEGYGYVITPGAVALIPDGKGPDFRADAATDALALCAAALKARAASGIETEGHDREDGHGAEHESPTAESGDANV